ncbi:hypothetical protein [Alysiella filiformis]|uniref:Uncharacterized protein n=1 Tax=Alysiella filiformis DSM 16848 TaxID=1120981 RepID=A0A286E9H0_9NEIS|nr:hypothetical protein [Alysiella filiformis]QMT31418.1 hypothetical protein H3L97_00420 [Alysiella filiformis]UBQ55572.1 hypothetical protein JF568_08250 [Alysiella filiformis DSM 16848]SOD67530.1 hypothetical protein SAMN02746062_00939 [Alysiella filiformis DSM 16848]
MDINEIDLGIAVVSGTLVGFLLFFLIIWFIIRRLLAKQEKQLGYPHVQESFDDFKLLVFLQQDIFALRIYRRLYPKSHLSEAKYMMDKVRGEAKDNLQEAANEVAQKIQAARRKIKPKHIHNKQ